MYNAEAELPDGRRLTMTGTLEACIRWAEAVKQEYGRETPIRIAEITVSRQ